MRVFLLLLPLLAVGCDSFGADPEPAADLVLTLSQGTLLLETEADYPCLGYGLATDADVDEDGAEVEIEGVLPPAGDACATALGPATARVPLPDPLPQQYTITLEKDGETDRYRYTCGFAGCFLEAVGVPAFSRFGPRAQG